MDEIKNKIESVLFMTGRFMSVEEIAEFVGIGSKGAVREAIQSLKLDYQNRRTGLAIFEEDKLFRLNIRKEYNHLSTKLVAGSDLDVPTQSTLAIIAYKQPARQSDIIKMRGSTAYDHIKSLKEQGFITSEKSGRTRILKITQKFYDYFDIVEQEALKKQFVQIAEREEKKADEMFQNEVKEDAKREMISQLGGTIEADKKREPNQITILSNVEHHEADDFGS
jgi:segregation and condensation protein B